MGKAGHNCGRERKKDNARLDKDELNALLIRQLTEALNKKTRSEAGKRKSRLSTSSSEDDTKDQYGHRTRSNSVGKTESPPTKSVKIADSQDKHASKRKSVLLDSSSEDEKKRLHGQNRRSSSEVFEEVLERHPNKSVKIASPATNKKHKRLASLTSDSLSISSEGSATVSHQTRGQAGKHSLIAQVSRSERQGLFNVRNAPDSSSDSDDFKEKGGEINAFRMRRAKHAAEAEGKNVQQPESPNIDERDDSSHFGLRTADHGCTVSTTGKATVPEGEMKVSRDFNVYDAFTLLENVPPTEKVRRTPLIGNLRRDTVYYFDLSESNKPIFVDDYAYGQKERRDWCLKRSGLKPNKRPQEESLIFHWQYVLRDKGKETDCHKFVYTFPENNKRDYVSEWKPAVCLVHFKGSGDFNNARPLVKHGNSGRYKNILHALKGVKGSSKETEKINSDGKSFFRRHIMRKTGTANIEKQQQKRNVSNKLAKATHSASGVGNLMG